MSATYGKSGKQMVVRGSKIFYSKVESQAVCVFMGENELCGGGDEENIFPS